jgi:hypothetical protein
MKIKDLIPESTFGTIVTVKDEFSLRKLDLFLSYNYNFISVFDSIILSLNYLVDTSKEVVEEYKNKWLQYFPNSIILQSDNNRGHMFGTIDLEEDILKYMKSNIPNKKYLFKSMDDVITSDSLLEVEIPLVDFYYIPGFSYESILNAGSKQKLRSIYEDFETGFFTPQTTFFVVNIDNIDMLYGNDIEHKYDVYQEKKKQNPNIKPWEIPFDIKFDCETHLARTVKDKSKYCLIANKFSNLLDLVEQIPIWDPSHKNVLLKNIGMCHYHYYDQPVFEV